MKIQDYIDPDKAENEIKENTELKILLIAVALVAPTAPAVTPIILIVVFITLIAAFIALATAFTALIATPASTKIAIFILLNQQNNQ